MSTLAHKSTKGIYLSQVVIMILDMLTISRKQHKIFRTVVLFDFVDMVHDFFGRKIASNYFLHDKNASFDIPSLISSRMRGLENVNIITLISSAIPSRVFSAINTSAKMIAHAFSLAILADEVSHFLREMLAKEMMIHSATLWKLATAYRTWFSSLDNGIALKRTKFGPRPLFAIHAYILGINFTAHNAGLSWLYHALYSTILTNHPQLPYYVISLPIE